jgi:hypothetical protein
MSSPNIAISLASLVTSTQSTPTTRSGRLTTSMRRRSGHTRTGFNGSAARTDRPGERYACPLNIWTQLLLAHLCSFMHATLFR